LIGVGGIENRNAVQAGHCVYDMFLTFKELGNWKPLVEKIWQDENPGVPIPKELTLWIQNPVMTRWWTIGKVMRFMNKHWNLIFRMSKCVINISTTAEAKNKIASGLYSLMRTKAIQAKVSFLATFVDEYLDENMAWFGPIDKNVGTPGFLTFHWTVRYFLMVTQLEDLLANWRTSPAFQRLRDLLDELPTEEKSIMETLPEKFLATAIKQVHMHNHRYLQTDLVVKSALGETATGKFVTRLLLGQSLIDDTGAIICDNEAELEAFVSPIHGCTVDIKNFVRFQGVRRIQYMGRNYSFSRGDSCTNT
jgi:hypothetical protein